MSHDENQPASPLNATIIRRVDLNDQQFILHIRPDSGVVPEFEPGQFINLGLVKDDAPPSPVDRPGRVRLVRRSYSIASPPSVRGYVELLLVLVPDGKLTPRIWDLREGDRLWMEDRCRGDFTLDTVPRGVNLMMIATGTGVAPFVSMLRQYHGSGRWKKLVLLHGVRRVADLAYRDEIEALARRDPGLVYLPTVTREPEDSHWPGLRGRVNLLLCEPPYSSLTGCALTPVHTHALLCGNPGMIQTVQKQLEDLGFVTDTRDNAGNIHFERYW